MIYYRDPAQCMFYFQRKKRMEQLEHELLETRASEDKKKKIKMVSRTQLVSLSSSKYLISLINTEFKIQ